jgi:hypothetical protein
MTHVLAPGVETNLPQPSPAVKGSFRHAASLTHEGLFPIFEPPRSANNSVCPHAARSMPEADAVGFDQNGCHVV